MYFQKRQINEQEVGENVLSITHHMGNVNQKHIEISPHTCQNGYYKKDKK